jgi:hypothetical protein
MRKLRGDVIDSVKAMFGKGTLHQRSIAKIALDACQPRQCVFIWFEIDVDDSVAFAQKTPLEDAAEEPRSASNQNVGHLALLSMMREAKSFIAVARRLAIPAECGSCGLSRVPAAKRHPAFIS